MTLLVVLDKSNQTDKYSAATFLINAGIQPLIDDRHAIAHSKVMVIDAATILTGSFNFTKAAEEKNAENLLVITNAPALVQRYEANIRLHAAHSRPYTRPVAAAPGKTPPPAATRGMVQGTPTSKIYHLPGCPGYATLSAAKRVRFATEAVAQQAGYRKAKNCP